jgi:hypothetical protein
MGFIINSTLCYKNKFLLIHLNSLKLCMSSSDCLFEIMDVLQMNKDLISVTLKCYSLTKLDKDMTKAVHKYFSENWYRTIIIDYVSQIRNLGFISTTI